MKRGMGTIALFAVLLAGARFASRQASTSSTVNAGAKPQSVPRESLPEDDSCEAFANPVSGEASSSKGEVTSLVQRYLYGTPQKEQLTQGAIPEDIKFMIVTVPDPRRTHLSLQFDRTLEAVQQALQDEHYTYDSSWLPWKQETTKYQGFDDQAKAAQETSRRELCPGLVLFRRNMTTTSTPDCPVRQISGKTPDNTPAPYRCGIFTFVVSETPTVGLNQIQWKNALAWIDNYASKARSDKVLRILGPTFSGSMPSVVRTLTGLDPANSSFTSALLYSGRIRGCGSWRWLNAQLNGSTKLPVRTSDFDENDAIQIDRFFKWIAAQGHALSEVAVLSEDETAYGGLPDARARPTEATGTGAADASSAQLCEPPYSPTNRPVHLYYPRDISAVRSAYEEQSIFSPTGASTDTSVTPHTVLHPEYEPTTHTATDSIEPFSGQGMALTEEAQLYGIVSTLRTHGIRYVILRSTNSLDYLFLARFLRRAYPDAYIITMGSDMLFGREIDSTEFRGVVALTAFPLLPRGQDWTVQEAKLPQHAHRVFGSEIMEGVYLAARFLTTDDGPTKPDTAPYVHPPKPDIPDYSTPFWEPDAKTESSKASTWLSVMGREGYWPLAVLTSPYDGRLPASNLTPVRAPSTRVQEESARTRFSFSLSSPWKFCCLLAVMMICMHFFACRYGWQSQDLGIFIQFTPLPGSRQPALMMLGSATVCSFLVLLFLASARIYSWLRSTDQIWVWIVGMFAAFGCAAVLFDVRPKDTGEGKRSHASRRRLQQNLLAWKLVTLVVIGLLCVIGVRIFAYGVPSGVTTAYRAVHLTSGISPLVSLLLMLGGFYWWFWQTLCGLALLGRGRPVLPRRQSLPPGLSRISDEMAENIESPALPFPDFRRLNRLFYLLPLFLLCLQACVMQRPWVDGFGFDSILRSLESRVFNWMLHWMFAIGLYLLMLDCSQLLITWFRLKRLLLALNRLPLRRTFAALQGLSMHSLWSMSGTSSRARYTIFSHQIESLVHFRNELGSSDARDCGGPTLRHAIDKSFVHAMRFIETRSQGADLAMVNDSEALAVRRSLSRCTEQVIRTFLVPEWFAERISMDIAETTGGGPADPSKEHLPLSGKQSVRLAEEFVCLVYVGYLQNLLARLRTMVLSTTGVFAAIALSVAFYPYTPRPLLALSLLLLLMALGAVVAVVYAGLDRDSTLSHITNTEPGKLGANFWIRILSFVGVPAMGLIVAQFPEITDFVVSWVQPSMNAVK
jgi:hypothetical protein